ncbi:MAG: hypothetical protein QOF14_3160 [Hyphomicrobiales bacterium]|jgi:hypothetical protein|nr:hypothetical protein [Hyphomicrobiales bacterium]
MLSSLPKLADKAFILGFFLPTLLFVICLIALFSDQEWTKTVLQAAFEKDAWDKLAYFVLAVWSLSVLLMMTNHLQFRLLEGYLKPISGIGWFRKREAARFKEKNERFGELNDEWKRLGNKFPEERKREWLKARADLVRAFPPKAALHLPTRFGNAIRAFESYSRDVYGADSIPLWLHLSTVVSKEFTAALEDARSQVNCIMNICYFTAILAAVALARSIEGLDWSALAVSQPCCELAKVINWQSALFLALALAAAGVSRLAYLFSVVLVYAWGDLVKAAFDCYLPALAEKLGYKLPETGAKRNAFWVAVSLQAIAWQPFKPEDWKPAEMKQAPGSDAHT